LSWICFRSSNFDGLNLSNCFFCHCDLCGATFGCINWIEAKYSIYSYMEKGNYNKLLMGITDNLSSGLLNKAYETKAILPAPEKIDGIWIYNRCYLAIASNYNPVINGLREAVPGANTGNATYANYGFFGSIVFDAPFPEENISPFLARERGDHPVLTLPRLPIQAQLTTPNNSAQMCRTLPHPPTNDNRPRSLPCTVPTGTHTGTLVTTNCTTMTPTPGALATCTTPTPTSAALPLRPTPPPKPKSWRQMPTQRSLPLTPQAVHHPVVATAATLSASQTPEPRTLPTPPPRTLPRPPVRP
jgi:hypothetical protein